jgi:MFS family permease
MTNLASGSSDSTGRIWEANIRRLYLFEFLSMFQLWIPIWVLYLLYERGLTLAQVTLLEAVFQLVIVVSEMPTGAVADRWGRKLSMLLGGILFAASILVFGLAGNYVLILVAYVGWATSHTLFTGAETALLHDTLAELGREHEFSRIVGRLRAVAISAAMCATLVGAPLAAETGLRTPILLGAVMAALAVVVIVGLRDPHRQREEVALPYWQILGQSLRYASGHAELRTMMALAAVVMSVAITGHIFIQPFLVGHGISVGEIGFFILAAQALAVAGALLSHRLQARFGEQPLIMLILVTWIAGLAVLAGLPSLLAFTAFPIFYFCQSAFQPLASDYVNRHSPQHLRATLASVASMGASLLVVVTQPGFGLAADEFSLRGSFFVCGLFLAIAGGLAFLFWSSAARRAILEPEAAASVATVD